MTGLSKVSLWLVIGFTSQAVFTARFLVQWIASERKRDSVVPVAFWWLSLVGGTMLLSYAVHKRDPVFVVGQSAGVFIYVRNLMLVSRKAARTARRGRRVDSPAREVSRPNALTVQDSSTDFAYPSAEDRAAILEYLRATKPDLLADWKWNVLISGARQV